MSYVLVLRPFATDETEKETPPKAMESIWRLTHRPTPTPLDALASRFLAQASER